MKRKYIDAERFAERYKNLEKVARRHLAETDPIYSVYKKWLTQVEERVAVQDDLAAFPGIYIDDGEEV